MAYSKNRKDIIGKFWDNNGDKFKKKFDGIEDAVKAAVGDLTERTLKKKENVENYPTTEDAKVEELKKVGFINIIKDYFNEEPLVNKAKFDDWHHKACEKVESAFAKYYDNWAYGKAQKIVNMTLKYVYCLDWSEGCREHFKFCHIPLDSYTLEWIVRNIFDKDIFDGRQGNNGKPLNAIKGLVDSWSNLKFKLEGESIKENEKYPYKYFVDWVRKYFSDQQKSIDYSELFPLEAEFYIWKEIQLHIALEGILNYFGEDKQKQDNLLSKCSAVKELLDKKIIELTNNP